MVVLKNLLDYTHNFVKEKKYQSQLNKKSNNQNEALSIKDQIFMKVIIVLYHLKRKNKNNPNNKNRCRIIINNRSNFILRIHEVGGF